MTTIDRLLWESFIPDPYPDTPPTYEQFAKKREKVWLADDIRDALQLVQSLKTLQTHPDTDELIKLATEDLNALYKQKIELEIGWVR